MRLRYCYIVSAIFFAYPTQCIKSTNIYGDIQKYFESAVVTKFRQQWGLFSRAFDNAITTTLTENFGDNILKIYMPSDKRNLVVSNGFFSSDSIIDLLCLKMVLRALPRLPAATVNVALASNVLVVESFVEKMFIDTNYKLYRNFSSVLDQGEQDPYKNSPFTFTQVQDKGNLAVIVEDCSLYGTIVATLEGSSVSLGQDTLRLKDCKFSVEISSFGAAEPPVIAPYFSSLKGLELMQLLSQPIRQALMARLQGAVLSYINTTDVFSKNIGIISTVQRQIVRKCRDYTTELVSNINKISYKKNQGTLKLDDLKISLYQMEEGRPVLNVLRLIKVTVTGLETAYAANIGGPITLKIAFLLDEITFNSLQIRGIMVRDNGTTTTYSNFAAEILDFAVSMSVNVPKYGKPKGSFAAKGWRSVQFSIINFDGLTTTKEHAHALIEGYLSDKIPKLIVTYLTGVYEEAHKLTENDGPNDNRGKQAMNEVDTNKNEVEPEVEPEVDTNKNEVEPGVEPEVEPDNLDADTNENDGRKQFRRSKVVSQSDKEDIIVSRKRDSKRNLRL